MQKYDIICQKLIFPGVASWKNIRFNSERMTADRYEKVAINVKGDRLFSILILFWNWNLSCNIKK